MVFWALVGKSIITQLINLNNKNWSPIFYWISRNQTNLSFVTAEKEGIKGWENLA